MGMLQIKCVKGSDIETYITDLAALRIKIFHDYPYLYDGNLEYEKKYLTTYSECADSVFVLAMDDNKVIGVSTALPLRNETNYVKAPFSAAGLDIDSIFYLGESVLLHDYRGQKIGEQFFAEREAEARKQGCVITTFCAVERSPDHPARPQNWHPLDMFWQRLGYRKQHDLQTLFSWKEIDEQEESEKPMTFWMKQ